MNNMKFFSRQLVGRIVENISGNTIGVLDDIVLDTIGGRVKYLLINPTGSIINKSAKVDEHGRLVVETGRIRLEGDRIVIN